MNDPITPIESLCTDFVNTYHGKLTWEWDDRFDAALATCEAENKDDVHGSLESHMKTIWNSAGADSAPDNVLDVINHFGGLMPEQLLFTTDPHQDILLCCAWWPWGDGNTISLRMVPPSQNELSDKDQAEFIKKFKGWFKI